MLPGALGGAHLVFSKIYQINASQAISIYDLKEGINTKHEFLIRQESSTPTEPERDCVWGAAAAEARARAKGGRLGAEDTLSARPGRPPKVLPMLVPAPMLALGGPNRPPLPVLGAPKDESGASSEKGLPPARHGEWLPG